MEFPLEAILETILVGSIASLFLLSLLFLFFGHVFRVEPIRRFVQFALYEDKSVKREEKPPAESPEQHLSFALLLLVALLYGLGATVESITHDITNDKRIKAAAFEKVGRGQVQGNTAPLDFARFVTDDISCRAIGIAPSSLVEDSPCQEVYRKEREFYYAAKNTVFQKESFAKELAALQSRIDFVRSACLSLGLLCLATLLATIIASIFEWLVKDSEGKVSSGQADQGRPTLAQHWKDLAAVRCLLITLLLASFTGVSWIAWQKVETQYDRRVFGYFLSLDAARPTEAAPEEKEAPTHNDESAHAPTKFNFHRLPSSPYRTFSAAWPTPFEPSAIQALGQSSRVIVANDRGGASPFLLFDFAASGFHRPRVLQAGDKAGLPFIQAHSAQKFEALHYAAKGKDDQPRILAIAATPLEPGGKLSAIEFSVDFANALAEDIRTVTIANPCRTVAGTNADPAISCSIEGVALRNDPEHGGTLLLGVRYLLGPKAREHTPVMAVVGLERAGDAWTNPKIVFQPGRDYRDPCPGLSGVSDIQILDAEHLLVLTSVELWSNDQCDAGSAPPIPVAQVRGALWLIHQSKNGPATDAHLLKRFAHKPEGLTILDDGSALVVFDDDGHRKSLSRAPDTFALEQNQSVFTIVRLDDELTHQAMRHPQ